LAAVAVLVWSTSEDRVSWAVLGTVPLVAAAIVLRYGSPVVLGVSAVVVLVWRRTAVRRHPFRVGLLVVSAGSCAWALLFTRLLTSRLSPVSAIAEQGTTGADLGNLAGPLRYGRILLDQLGSPSGALMLAGLAASAFARGRSAPDGRFDGQGGERARGARCFGVTALVGLIALGVLVHPEARYLTPIVPFAALAGGYGLGNLAELVPMRAAVALGAAVLVGVTVGALGTVEYDARGEARGNNVLKNVLVSYPFPPECSIATGTGPQVMWYSECRVVAFGSDPVIPPAAGFAMDVQEGKNQPPDLAAALEAWGRPVAGGDPVLYYRGATLWQAR
jgi:hypothetical protein